MIQPVFYLLDRNAIIMIEKFLKGIFSNGNSEWDACKAVFDRIDQPQNTVSAMFAIIEGKQAINHLPIERQISACAEAGVLKKYFKNANTDTKSIVKLSHLIADVSLGSHEHGFGLHIKFYNRISKKLSQDVPANKLIEVEDSVLFAAKTYNVSHNHPIVISSLSALHGNMTAKKILNFRTGKKSNPYGAVSDIMQYGSVYSNIFASYKQIILISREKSA